jgi:GT2 family glycosyltransferase
MKLSIVIVNYNVKFFLEQCLQSVERALKGIPSEVFVVDNASVDDSMQMVAEKFPAVLRIANKDNVGFSKANNQAIRQSKGEYVLLLNPDTVVEENTFKEVLAFMDAHEDAGALGVKMIDGKGNYLPESKRGLPTPMVAFYKMFGFTSLFPKSKRFARYYMGHLSENENHEVEILAGAFMLMRKTALDKSGLLDEDFFMYGEDIDLSYRITKAGFKNYYCADTSIIHYKGESTKKGSLNYVYVFYNAMVIFAQKHFSQSYARFFGLFINLAIYLRAGLSLLKRFVKAISFPIFDAALLYGGLFYIKEYWENNHRFIEGGEYPTALLLYAFPAYIIIWLICLFFSGGYKKPAKFFNLIKGLLWGTLLILVAYSLVDNSLRFSRAIILLGAVWATLSIPFSRWLLQRLFGWKLLQQAVKERRVGIVGGPDEAQRVEKLIKQAGEKISFVGFISVAQEHDEEANYIGHYEHIEELSRIFELDEIIFCAEDLESERIFKSMTLLNPLNLEIKIAPSQSQFVIGSNSIDHKGSWYGIQLNDLSKRENKRSKRAFDFFSAVILLIGSPLLIWFSPRHYIQNCLAVLTAKKTWIGYDTRVSTTHLPALKEGVYKTTARLSHQLIDDNTASHLNQLYAKEYKVQTDLRYLLQNLF